MTFGKGTKRVYGAQFSYWSRRTRRQYRLDSIPSDRTCPYVSALKKKFENLLFSDQSEVYGTKFSTAVLSFDGQADRDW